ncbi:MAG: glycolate oxidase subunit GlcE [Rhodospirillales bacterium]|nr:glycolate oxidase subunit GlcE [Rhodospirillales bacterium]
MKTIRPETPEQLADAIGAAANDGTALSLIGGGSKTALGRPVNVGAMLDMSAFSGISMYEPEEMVMTAGAGTSLAEIVSTLRQSGQRLAFEPADFGSLLGGAAEQGTIGGVFSCNLCGPRRMQAGAARDHIFGFQAVNGRGELFKSGGRVVKNVTGFDLSKLMAGAYGTLAALTEVTFRVLPVAEKTRTVLVSVKDDETAIKAMTAAMQSPYDVSGAAHLPADVAAISGVSYVASAGSAVTALRVEGTEASVAFRCNALRDLMAPFGSVEELHTANSEALWAEVRDGAFLVGAGERPVWQVSVPPNDGAAVAARILRDAPGHHYYDWAGGLIWLALEPRDDAGHETVRSAFNECGGHATLIRAEESIRASVPVFQPLPAPMEALTRRLKYAFDPKGVFNPGRLAEGR